MAEILPLDFKNIPTHRLGGEVFYKISDILRTVALSRQSHLAKIIKEYPEKIRYFHIIDPKTNKKSQHKHQFIEQSIFLLILAKCDSVQAKSFILGIFEKVEILE